MDVFLIASIVLAIISLAGLVHYNGFKIGYKMGLEKGVTEINEYAVKVNEAQNERIIQLMHEVNLQRQENEH